jgi:DNA-binding response OmpR family regulator
MTAAAISEKDRIAATFRRDGSEFVQTRSLAEAERALQNSFAPRVVCLEVILPRDSEKLSRFLLAAPAVVTITRNGAICRAYVSNLDAGQDPSASEISVRLRAALRSDRRPLSIASRWRFQSLDKRIVADSARETMRKDGEEVKLSFSEWEILCCLAKAPGNIWTREDLLMGTSRGSESGKLASARVIDAHVKNMRSKIEDAPHNPVYLRTARGRGYYLHGFAPGRRTP